MHIINEKPYAIPFYFVLFQVSRAACIPHAARPASLLGPLMLETDSFHDVIFTPSGCLLHLQ
jgi:hypothetical protein